MEEGRDKRELEGERGKRVREEREGEKRGRQKAKEEIEVAGPRERDTV
jgi:hypothetical protein